MAYRNYGPAVGFVVDKNGHGDFTTITAAVAAAPAGSTIFINPGTYTENFSITKNLALTALYTGGLQALENTSIVGKITVSTGSITVNFFGLSFASNADNILLLSGNASNVVFNNCDFNISTSAALVQNISSNLRLMYCKASGSANLITQTGGDCRCYWCDFGGGIGGTSTIGPGAFTIDYCNSDHTFNTTGVGIILSQYTIFSQTVTLAGTGASIFSHANFNTAANSAISIGAGTSATVTNSMINSSATNVLTGAGTLNYGLISFAGSSSGHNVTTENPLATLI